VQRHIIGIAIIVRRMRIHFELKQLDVVRMMLKVMTANDLTINNAKAKTATTRTKGRIDGASSLAKLIQRGFSRLCILSFHYIIVSKHN